MPPKKRPYHFHRPHSGPLVDAITEAFAFRGRMPDAEIADVTGLPEADLPAIYADHQSYLFAHGYARMALCVPKNLPTPQEVAEACAEFDRANAARKLAQRSPKEVPPGREPTRTHWRQVKCPA